MISIFDTTLGSILPEKFYPIIGEITITDVKTNQVMMYGTCEIPSYDPCKQNNYIYVRADYKLVGHRNESNTVMIKADDIPMSLKYHINAIVNNDEFNRMYLTGTCRGDHEVTINESGVHIKLVPMKQVDIEKNEIKLCDINVWKE